MGKLIIYGIIAATIMGAIYGAWRAVDHWCNAACVEQTEIVVELRAQIVELNTRIVALNGVIKAAQERATFLALLWVKELDNVKERYVERVEIRTVAFKGLRERAGAISPEPDSCTLRLSAQRQQLLADATRYANRGDDPAVTPVDKGPAPAVPGPAGVSEGQAAELLGLVDSAEVTAKWLDAAESYASAREKWAACVIAYEAIEKPTAGIVQPEVPK